MKYAIYATVTKMHAPVFADVDFEVDDVSQLLSDHALPRARGRAAQRSERWAAPLCSSASRLSISDEH